MSASFGFICIGIFLIAGSSVISVPRAETSKSKRFLLPPAELKRFTLGYDDTVADTLWVRAIQDLDFCEKGSPAPLVARSQDEILAGKGVIEKSPCQSGWVYHMLDAITELAPRFTTPYTFGAPMLSVIVVDQKGASLLYDKGLKQFPKNGILAFHAAYHALFEEANPARAAELLIHSAKNGGPPWATALAARILQKDGQLTLAKASLTDMIEKLPEGDEDRARLQMRLGEIEKSLTESSQR